MALDSDYAIWQSFNNQYWPAHYSTIDAEGRIRGHHFGEGEYDQSEQTIRKLLIAAGHADLPPAGMDSAGVSGVQAPPDEVHDQSPETYVGYRRGENFASAGGFVPSDQTHLYAAPGDLQVESMDVGGLLECGP